MPFVRVAGRKSGRRVVLYALSTCGWCRMAKELLAEAGVEHEYVDVDLCAGEERTRVTAEVRRLNPRCNYPVLVVGDRVIVGYDPEKIREALAR